MPPAVPTVASRLEPFFNAALAERLTAPVLALPRGVPSALPQDIRVLVAAPMDRAATAPPGWPFGLQWIQLLTSGTDMYPAWLLDTVPVSTARGVASEAIAEYVAAAIFDDAKQLSTLWVRGPAQWSPRPLASVRGSSVGLVGLGAIGTAVARTMRALGAHVVALRRRAQASPVEGVQLVSDLHTLVAQVDHLVLAAPSTPETRHLLNRRVFEAARPGLHVINVARGELIDDDALLAALRAGQVRRATLDATAPEPLPEGHPFYAHPAIRLSPHTSAVGTASRIALVDKFILNQELHRAGQALRDPVHAV